MAPGKGYVDVSMVDAATSRQVAVAVRAAGGAYLEAPVSGSKGRAARLPAPAFFALRSSWPPGRRRRPVGARREREAAGQRFGSLLGNTFNDLGGCWRKKGRLAALIGGPALMAAAGLPACLLRRRR